jgi:hypothetical protein
MNALGDRIGHALGGKQQRGQSCGRLFAPLPEGEGFAALVPMG